MKHDESIVDSLTSASSDHLTCGAFAWCKFMRWPTNIEPIESFYLMSNNSTFTELSKIYRHCLRIVQSASCIICGGHHLASKGCRLVFSNVQADGRRLQGGFDHEEELGAAYPTNDPGPYNCRFL
jgi:hypothetical protein